MMNLLMTVDATNVVPWILLAVVVLVVLSPLILLWWESVCWHAYRDDKDDPDLQRCIHCNRPRLKKPKKVFGPALKPTKPWPHKQPSLPTATPDEQQGLRIIEHTTYVPHPRLRAILALALTAGACAGALAGWLASGGIQ